MNSSCQEGEKTMHTDESVIRQLVDILLRMTDKQLAVFQETAKMLINDSTKSPKECIKLAKEKLGYR